MVPQYGRVVGEHPVPGQGVTSPRQQGLEVAEVLVGAPPHQDLVADDDEPEGACAQNKAVVLDGKNCTWSKRCIGMPSVVVVGKRLAIFYDAPGGDSTSHMGRNLGLAWLELPLSPPKQ